jgi:hypothetical protein
MSSEFGELNGTIKNDNRINQILKKMIGKTTNSELFTKHSKEKQKNE